MRAADLQSLASAVYGSRWQSQLSREMGVALRTVQRWARDGIDKPAKAGKARIEKRALSELPLPRLMRGA